MKPSKKVYLSILLGVFLEYFDYTLYAFSVPYIVVTFFSMNKPENNLIFTWAIFAIGFLLRPIGAFIFGHIADRTGRRFILTFNILLMSISTMAMGLLPGYQQVGVLSPILLIICRILQGLAVSTGYSGCGTYLLEFKKLKQGLTSGIMTSATGFGVFAASLSVLLFNSKFFTFPLIANWRWLFIVAGFGIGLLGFYLRRDLAESPCFLDAQQEKKLVSFPILPLIKNKKKVFFSSVIISAYAGISIILVEVYLPSYLHIHLGIRKEKALEISTYLALLEAFCAIFWGMCSDYIGTIKVLWIAGLMMIVGIFPLLKLFNQPLSILWFCAATCLAFIVGAVDGPLATLLASNFSTETRYTGVSLSYNLGIAIIGGMSPGLLEFIQSRCEMTKILGWYLTMGAVSMLIALVVLSKSKNSSIS